MSTPTTIVATAPAKAILLGEHAVNRGQAALAVSVGVRATCKLTVDPGPGAPDRYLLVGGGHECATTRRDVLALGERADGWRGRGDYAAIQRAAADDFFAPTMYVLAGFGTALPPTLEVRFASDIPPSSGLGSGGATFVALAAALAAALGGSADPRRIAALAQRGDIVAHGGVASGLDTQTSLYGGAIRYTAEAEGEPIPHAVGLRLVVGHTGVEAATSQVNGRVREWLAAGPWRLHYFRQIGLLARLAEAALREGDWAELGRLLTLNHLVLARIGVSCPELEALVEAALAAGALGAKLSGSGGGGSMIALVTNETAGPVARAIAAAGGTPIVAPVAVPGVEIASGAGDPERLATGR